MSFDRSLTLHSARQPYCIGIGGIGVSAIARYFIATGRPVSGSDASRSPVTRELEALGVPITADSAALPPNMDLVVHSDAIPPKHPQRLAAVRRGLTTLSYAQALGQLIQESAERAVVTGTNGKTTTTALLAWLLLTADRDPTVVVGSLIPQLSGNYRQGDGRLVVCEGDEYLGHVLELHPTTLVITNIEFDHPDYFRSLDDVVALFQQLARRLPPTGSVIVNADDAASTQAFNGLTASSTTFSIEQPSARLFIQRLERMTDRQTIEIFWQEQSLGRTQLLLPGRYNVANAAAAAAAACQLGVSAHAILKGLATFRGSWRRFERLGTINGAALVSDYAHHPTSVRGVIAAAREAYPRHRLVVVFQPHHRRRLQALKQEFTEALSGADNIIVVEVYAVPGRELPEESHVTAADICDALRALGRSATFASNLDEAEAAIRPELKAQTVILMVGAGSIDALARKLAHH